MRGKGKLLPGFARVCFFGETCGFMGA